MKLTKAIVAKLKLPEGKSEVIHFDDTLRRFGIRLRAGGRRSWVIQYRIGRRQRRLTLGDAAVMNADAAREEAKRKLAKVDLGHDIQAEKIEAKARQHVTFGYVVNLYLETYAARRRPKTVSDTKRYLTKHFAVFADVPIDRIERKHVSARVREIATESGMTAAARARAALSALFSWAMREGIATNNPVIGTNGRGEPSQRNRVLSADEIERIWRACRDDDYGKILKLLILTGQRRQEIGGLRGDEIDLERAEIRLPPERTKNNRPHVIPLTPPAMQILEQVPRREGRVLLFGSGTAGYGGWHLAKRKLDERVAITSSERLRPWTVHDIRRTVATGMADLGVQPHVVEAVLNHVSGTKRGVAGTYNKSKYANEVKQALALWADHVGALVEDRERKVINIGGRHE
ncbi:MAG TPA: tyrosine-type recombinase/integrase, partial [Xanthobacteraceae bacterium]